MVHLPVSARTHYGLLMLTKAVKGNQTMMILIRWLCWLTCLYKPLHSLLFWKPAKSRCLVFQWMWFFDWCSSGVINTLEVNEPQCQVRFTLKSFTFNVDFPCPATTDTHRESTQVAHCRSQFYLLLRVFVSKKAIINFHMTLRHPRGVVYESLVTSENGKIGQNHITHAMDDFSVFLKCRFVIVFRVYAVCKQTKNYGIF